MKAKSSVEPEEKSVNSNAHVIDENLSAEVFELLWGHVRIAFASWVDYAFEQIWMQLVFSFVR
jgi:hypothetical protein